MHGYIYSLQLKWRDIEEDIDREYKIKLRYGEASIMAKSMKKQKKEKGEWETLTEYARRKEIAYQEAIKHRINK